MSPRLAIVFGLLSAAVGVVIVLAGIGVLPVAAAPDVQGSPWVVACAGLMFVFLGPGGRHFFEHGRPSSRPSASWARGACSAPPGKRKRGRASDPGRLRFQKESALSEPRANHSHFGGADNFSDTHQLPGQDRSDGRGR